MRPVSIVGIGQIPVKKNYDLSLRDMGAVVVSQAMADAGVDEIDALYASNMLSDELHFVKASRNAVLFFAVVLSAMAMISYFWQRYSDLSLISFALGVMAFAYTGLLGVYFSAIFTSRGSSATVPFALVGGFLTVLVLQPYMFGITIGFSWQMVIGTIVAFVIMQLGTISGAESE